MYKYGDVGFDIIYHAVNCFDLRTQKVWVLWSSDLSEELKNKCPFVSDRWVKLPVWRPASLSASGWSLHPVLWGAAACPHTAAAPLSPSPGGPAKSQSTLKTQHGEGLTTNMWTLFPKAYIQKNWIALTVKALVYINVVCCDQRL